MSPCALQKKNMEYRLSISKDVHFDIDGIVGYMIEKLQNRTAAVTFLEDVEKKEKAITVMRIFYCGRNYLDLL